MLRRVYLLTGDVLSTGGVGALTGLFLGWLVTEPWNPGLAMVVGMAAGVAVCLPLMAVLAPLFGAFEVMLPGMMAGMVSGMVVGMRSAVTRVTLPGAAAVGGVCGLLVMAATKLFDRAVRNGAGSWTS